jgi:hypothetical protein
MMRSAHASADMRGRGPMLCVRNAVSTDDGEATARGAERTQTGRTGRARGLMSSQTPGVCLLAGPSNLHHNIMLLVLLTEIHTCNGWGRAPT